MRIGQTQDVVSSSPCQWMAGGMRDLGDVADVSSDAGQIRFVVALSVSSPMRRKLLDIIPGPIQCSRVRKSLSLFFFFFFF